MNRTKVDWLGFRSKAEPKDAIRAIQAAYGPLGKGIQAKPRKRGWNGYEQAADLSLGEMHVGLLAFGGENQRGWIHADISGRGCQWITDWEEAEFAFAELPAFEPRRVDIALDTFKREATHEKVVAAHRAGLFTTRGKPPSMKRIEPEDPYEGRTVYVGARDSDKYLRGYEKGYELVKDFPKDLKFTKIDDVPIEDIYRLELECKAKTRQLPLDIIQNRDQYFAGAYPYLQTMLDVEPQIFVQRRERGPQLDLQAALAQIRKQYGTHLFTALAAYEGNVSAVWDQIVGKKHNDKLVQAGVLQVEHNEP